MVRIQDFQSCDMSSILVGDTNIFLDTHSNLYYKSTVFGIMYLGFYKYIQQLLISKYMGLLKLNVLSLLLGVVTQ